MSRSKEAVYLSIYRKKNRPSIEYSTDMHAVMDSSSKSIPQQHRSGSVQDDLQVEDSQLSFGTSQQSFMGKDGKKQKEGFVPYSQNTQSQTGMKNHIGIPVLNHKRQRNIAGEVLDKALTSLGNSRPNTVERFELAKAISQNDMKRLSNQSAMDSKAYNDRYSSAFNAYMNASKDSN